MKNRKGSASVFLIFILTAMITLTAVFIYAAKRAAVISYGDGILNLACRSILSEFNLELKDRYGIFAFEKTGEEVEAEIKEYADYALHDNQEAKVTGIRAGFGEYSLADPRIIKEQILDHMKFALAEDLLDKWESDKSGQKREDRTLRNRRIIDSLPSAPLKSSSPGFADRIAEIKDKIGSIDEIFNQSKETYLLDRYILLKFKNALEDRVGRATFFENEVEYILEGDYSNKKNKAEVRRGIVLFRSGFNAAYLYLDEEKRAQTLAAAEVLTPGPQAVLTQAILIGTWAFAEAENDARLLEKGKPVVLFKDKASWATDLDSVLSNRDEGCIDTGNRKGFYYQDYLMIFLHFESETLKLARMMDLIQINMKGTSSRDFLLKNYNGGFRLKAKISGREREYDTRY
ncbi:DUF5702 domain-containing protein [Anaerovorax odorimutans]|uniref:DUF5702 domain-containing protein n=1 Tax=Anaerovorax odorimutans TaxID=109327 RepID=A0ABT1RMW4_9FIRM|nr:DUF5702 domain-containing protein [Anaerovorax odorimutans]MCQ4636266.1 DUF5702 domain-containing protein [Anaerovorax odorimutans]